MVNQKAYIFIPDDENRYSKGKEVESSKVRYFFVGSGMDISGRSESISGQTITEPATVIYNSVNSSNGDNAQKHLIPTIRAIEYQYLQQLGGRHLFNLAFGVYDIDRDAIIDDVITNDGDVYKVFYTVLNTIPEFFSFYDDSILMVRGSDSGAGFVAYCKANCKKKCSGNICRNADRRIKIYQSYVDRNYNELIQRYNFFGIASQDDVMEPYSKGKRYDAVFVLRK